MPVIYLASSLAMYLTALTISSVSSQGVFKRLPAERSAGNLLKTPWLETEDIVHAVKYIASDEARYMTGNQFVLDAGLLTD